jgi:ABC-type maltose transport system permease subunit
VYYLFLIAIPFQSIMPPLYIELQRYVISGITVGAVKG